MGSHSHDHHEHGHDHPHGHTHGIVDPSIATSKRGIWAIKWSFVGLFVTALLQVVVVYYSQSVALLADTIHNFGDALTAVPLWIAFAFALKQANKRFTYGYGRVEDLAGICIVLVIFVSAVIAAYESIERFVYPQPVNYLWAVMAASIIGFAGNEAVALFRIKVGMRIESAALIADGYHARVDGLTSLAVLAGAIGVWLGFPLADPIVGVLITLAIIRIVWQSCKAVFTRSLDGVDEGLVERIEKVAGKVEGVKDVGEVRARWIGHRLAAEINVSVASELSVAAGHEIAKEVRHRLMHELEYLSRLTVHVDPMEESGETYHHIIEHTHDGLPTHSH
jgi:cation diffusion facilitator family transporter